MSVGISTIEKDFKTAGLDDAGESPKFLGKLNFPSFGAALHLPSVGFQRLKTSQNRQIENVRVYDRFADILRLFFADSDNSHCWCYFLRHLQANETILL